MLIIMTWSLHNLENIIPGIFHIFSWFKSYFFWLLFSTIYLNKTNITFTLLSEMLLYCTKMQLFLNMNPRFDVHNYKTNKTKIKKIWTFWPYKYFIMKFMPFCCFLVSVSTMWLMHVNHLFYYATILTLC